MAEDHDFSNRTALITGAASGIGAATAHWLAARGVAQLVLVDRDEASLAALKLSCPVRAYSGDVADEALWDEIEDEVPRLDHALLNAGIADGCPIPELSFAEWRRTLSTNLDGMFLSLRGALRIMQRAGTGRSLALTASVSGVKAEPGTAAYAASKAGVIQLAKVAAKEAAPLGIRVNAIAPGGVDTPIWDEVPFFQDMIREHGTRAAAIAAMGAMATPLGRYSSAEEIAGQIGFLLSDAAAGITGSVLTTDGGYSL